MAVLVPGAMRLGLLPSHPLIQTWTQCRRAHKRSQAVPTVAFRCFQGCLWLWYGRKGTRNTNLLPMHPLFLWHTLVRAPPAGETVNLTAISCLMFHSCVRHTHHRPMSMELCRRQHMSPADTHEAVFTLIKGPRNELHTQNI